jgi:putative thioredoxin
MDLGLKKPAGTAVIKDATAATFAKDVLDASRDHLVIVDFWAAWCGPCKQLTPLLEKVVASYAGKVHLIKVNVDEQPAIAQQLRVQSLPTVYAFRDGRPLDGFAGARPEIAIREFIDRLLGDDGGDDIAAVLETAEQALEAGDLQTAAEVFAAVLQENQQNISALTGLARCYLKSGDLVRAEQTLALVPPEKAEQPVIQGVRASIELARQASGSDPRAALEERVSRDPADDQARYDLAVAHAARGNKEAAVEHLLALIRRNRAWNEEAARKQLVKLFDAWGAKDPATMDGRRRLSAILFS